VLSDAVATGVVPAAALAAGIGERTLVRIVRGTDAGTVFDLASLTKVMATMPAVLALADAGRLSLADPLGRYVPGFSGGVRGAITLQQLLTHTAGLLDSRRYYRRHTTCADVLAAVTAEPLVAAPGERVGYSDLGFLLLGRVVEVVTGTGLDRAVRELVHGPLGLSRTAYRPLDCPALAGGPFAVTTEPGAAPAVGRPHDRNAQACGDVAGHAGLFSVLDDVAAYAAWWAGAADGPVSPATREAALRCATEGLGGRRGLGWLLQGDAAAGDVLTSDWPATTALHTGFTGTSIAVDAGSGWWACLLTNAVHLGRGRPEVAALRTRVHELLAAELTGRA
jgi:serine-type D-Ala-D-Ala carboxypeptidase